MIGDALGVLFGTATLASKDTHINRLMMDLALILAPRGQAIEAVHVWSEDNALADALTRMQVDAEPPAQLRGIKRSGWPDDLPWKIAR